MKPSLRHRLVAGLAVLFAVAWLGVMILTHVVARRSVVAEFDAGLANDARTLLVLAVDKETSARRDIAAVPSGRVLPAFRTWRNGILRIASAQAPDFGRPGRAGYRYTAIAGVRWRVFTTSAADGTVVQVGEPTAVRTRLVYAMTREVVFPLLLALPLLAALVWWGVGRGLSPLRRVIEQVAGQSPSRLRPIDAREVPLEIDALVDAVNGLLALLGDALLRERRFSTDVGHEMRTPLAAIRAHAQLVARMGLTAEQRHSVDDIVGGVDHLDRLGEQLLTLARLEGASLTDVGESLTLRTVVDAAVAGLAHRAAARRIALQIETDDCQVRGQHEALAALVRNLTDNAIRYTPCGGSITIEIRRAGDTVLLSVTDSGPGISPAERERVFERFYRGERPPEADGCGLGLSIVRRIAALHGATVRLDEGPGGRGLRASVCFPALAAA